MSEFILNHNNYNTNQLADFLRREIPNSAVTKVHPVYVEIFKNGVTVRLLITDNTITIKPKRNAFLFWLFVIIIILPLQLIITGLQQSGIHLGALTFLIYLIGWTIALTVSYLISNAINSKKEERAEDLVNEIEKAFENNAAPPTTITNEPSTSTSSNTVSTLTTDELTILSVISPSILETLNDAKKRKIIAFINIIEPTDSIALYGSNKEVKRIDKERWAAIVEQGLADKFHVIYQKN